MNERIVNVAPQLIPVWNLQDHPQNPRIALRQDVVDAIAAGLGEGFDPAHALIVRPYGDEYQVLSGHHRKAAAARVGIDAVPCWVRELDDDAAYMALVTSNSQGELSPLEIGLHALHCVGLSEGGRGKKGGLSAYAELVGKDRSNIRMYRDGAEVAQKVGIDTHLSDKTQHLAAIHALPADCWQAMVELMLEHGWTVKQVQAVVEAARATLDKVPADWPADGLALMAVHKPREAAMWAAAIEEAVALVGKLAPVTLYRHDKTDEVVARGDRDYCVARAVAYDYDAPAQFRAQVADERTATGVRAVYARILKHIDEHSDGGEKLLPVLNDAEQAAKEQRDAEMLLAQVRAAKAAQVECGDCVQWLQGWSQGPIKLLLSDPPYGMAFQSNRRTSTTKTDAIAHDGDYETAMRLTADMLAAAMPHLAEDAHVILFCNDEGLFRLRAVVEAAGLEFRRVLVWVKPNHGSGDLKAFAPRKELAVHAVKGRPVVTPRRDDVYVQASVEKVTEHPTEKSVSLLKEWIECTTSEGDIVCDPFVGTGAAIVAAESLGRVGYGAELDPGYHAVAVQRLLEVGR